MKKLTFLQKLWIPLICSLLCITGIFIYGAIQTRNIRIEERRIDLNNIDDVALHMAKYYGDQEQAGTLPKEEAQKLAITAIKNLRYGTDGYVVVNNLDGMMLANPVKPELEGRNMIEFKDVNGSYFFREMAEIGKTESGTGYVNYVWPRPGQTEPGPKQSRVVTYKPWGWTLVTGVYMDDIDNAFRQSLLQSSGVLLVACILLALIVSAINRSLRQTIGGAPEYVAQVATTIAGNDLSQMVDTVQNDHSSVLFAMKKMQDNLVNTIAEIRRNAAGIVSASSEVASGSMDLSTRTESQASSLEETAASMEELTSTVKQNADNAHAANRLAETAFQTAEQANVVVSQLVENMNEINAKATRISAIIGVIDGIAFQTNILALNAAVEAARAGEQGRGFAVVAAEVRNLAQRSAAAAREVKTLINDSENAVRAGAQLTDQVGHDMRDIMEGSKRVSNIITEISTSSREQASGIEQVAATVTQMDDITQKNAALVEELAGAANLMQGQAAELLQLVSVFRFEETAMANRAMVKERNPVLAAPAASSNILPIRQKCKRATAGAQPIGSAVRKLQVAEAGNANWEQF
ncbi:MAG: methyl-accepting chemotaxis protein [Burkholderiales bacterium]